MASIFTTGTISQPDAVSVSLAMAEKIRDDLIAHAAWELVEEFLPSGGASRWYVFRCLASESGLPSDFYIIMGRTLSTGALAFLIAEAYDSTSKIASYFPVYGTTETHAFDAVGHASTTFTLGATALAFNNPGPVYSTWTPSGTSSKWWLIVAEDGFTVAFNGAVNGFVHAGAFTPMTPLSWPMPLQMVSSDSSSGGITRNPAVAGVSTYRGALKIQGGGNASPTGNLHLGFLGDLRYNDKLQNNNRPVAEQGIFIADPLGGGAQPNIGWAAGKQKRMRIGSQPPSGFAFGDAYSMQGRLWVPYKADDPRMWDTGVAA